MAVVAAAGSVTQMAGSGRLIGRPVPGTIHIREPGNGAVFSAKTDYGLIALLELASIHGQGGVLQVGEIAARQQIPDRYLEQMLTSLRRGQILRSIRGPRGGYQLAKAPSDIRVSDVVRCLEGDGAMPARSGRDTPEVEVVRGMEQQLADAHQRILEATTLQDLLDRRDQLAQSQAMYFI
jgi:Rrf2 family protein